MPLFSVIIPAYNRAPFIAQTLRSVLAQSFTNFEVIVIDDGSTDDTVAIARSFETSFSSRLRIVQQPNAGPARNHAASLATGDYLAFLDSDDLWQPWTLETYAALIASRNRPSILCAFPHPFSSESELASLTRAPLDVEVSADYLATNPLTVVPGAGTLVVRAHIFSQSRGFPTQRINAEDADLYLRLGIVPGFINVRAPVLVCYRTHDGAQNLSTPKSIAGRLFIAHGERTNRYPGGPARKLDRDKIISSHLRSGAVEALYVRAFSGALKLYLASFTANLRLHRFPFLFAFPLLFLAHALRLKSPPLSAPRTAALLRAALLRTAPVSTASAR